jgi:hypothetical protein
MRIRIYLKSEINDKAKSGSEKNVGFATFLDIFFTPKKYSYVVLTSKSSGAAYGGLPHQVERANPGINLASGLNLYFGTETAGNHQPPPPPVCEKMYRYFPIYSKR